MKVEETHDLWSLELESIEEHIPIFLARLVEERLGDGVGQENSNHTHLLPQFEQSSRSFDEPVNMTFLVSRIPFQRICRRIAEIQPKVCWRSIIDLSTEVVLYDISSLALILRPK